MQSNLDKDSRYRTDEKEKKFGSILDDYNLRSIDESMEHNIPVHDPDTMMIAD